jgi:phage tail sheath protein FI
MGDVNKAVQVFGMADFDRLYGGVTKDSDASYQIAQFFLNGGPSAWIVRVVDATAKVATATVGPIQADAKNEGAWGNGVRFTVEPVMDGAAVSTEVFNLTVSRYAAPDTIGAPIATERYAGLSIKSTSPRYYPTVVNATSQLVTLKAAGTTMPAFNGTLGGQLDPFTGTHSIGDFNGKTFTAQYPGESAVSVTLAVPDSVKTSTDLRILRGLVESQLQLKAAAAGSALARATVTLIGRGFLIALDPRAPGYKASNTIVMTGGDLKFPGTAAALESTLANGKDGGEPGAHDIIGDRSLHTGIYALDRADLFNLLCLPQLSDMSAGEMAYGMSQALDYCQQHRAFFLIDPPTDKKTPPDIEQWVNDNAALIVSPNSALYFPRIEVADPANNFALKSIGASGTVAGIFAKTDNDRGVWKAPAGIDAVLRGVANLAYPLSDGENGVLNQAGIDCLRNFPVYGQVVWGARTLYGADARASEWKYVPIRRLALMIEESLFRGTKWVVFEPNDEPLWAKIRQNVGAFMTGLFRQGAFQGSTPDKAFFVKCDGETTTANDRNLGVVNIEVGFAPLKPAEFVVLKIQQIPDLT